MNGDYVDAIMSALCRHDPRQGGDGVVAARAAAAWLANMLDEYADTYDADDVTERAYAIGFQGAAFEVRKAGDVL